MVDVEINLDIKKLMFSGFNKNLINFLEKYQMNSLTKRIFREKAIEKKQEIKKIESDQIGLF
jgi:hypothetical protein